MNIKKLAVRTLHIEAESLNHLKKLIDDDFITCVRLISKSSGRLIVSGIGKSAIIAQKMVATFNSTGTPFGAITTSSSAPRELQFAVRWDF